MYYWTTREGNAVARELHSERHLRVLAIFARRPKAGAARVIYGKLNVELYRFAYQAQNFGIPTVAGFPAVNNIFELGGEFQTIWFPLDEPVRDEVHFQLDMSTPNQAPMRLGGGALKTLKLEDLGDAIEAASVLSWKDAMTAIRSTRQALRIAGGGRYFWGGNPYTPVYVVVPD